MAFIAFDNFIWSPDVPVTYSSELVLAKGDNLKDIDPVIFWQTDDPNDQWVKLDLSLTGIRKPFVVGIYNHNLTPDAVVKLQADSSDDFSTPEAEDTIVIPEDIYDYKTTPQAANKFIVLCPNVLAESDINKAWIRLLIDDPDNPDGFIRIGILFICSILNFNYETPYELNTNSLSQQFINNSTVFYSLSNQMHVRPRKVIHRISGLVTLGGLYTRQTIRKIIRRVGTHNPCFISVGDNLFTNEVEGATQVYYGRFTKLPELNELSYYDHDTNNLEDNDLTSYNFEFTEMGA